MTGRNASGRGTPAPGWSARSGRHPSGSTHPCGEPRSSPPAIGHITIEPQAVWRARQAKVSIRPAHPARPSTVSPQRSVALRNESTVPPATGQSGVSSCRSAPAAGEPVPVAAQPLGQSPLAQPLTVFGGPVDRTGVPQQPRIGTATAAGRVGPIRVAGHRSQRLILNGCARGHWHPNASPAGGARGRSWRRWSAGPRSRSARVSAVTHGHTRCRAGHPSR